MEQQSTIFDKSFDNKPAHRRRNLMPAWLKVYTWVAIGFGIYVFSYLFFMTPDDIGGSSDRNSLHNQIIRLVIKIVVSCIYVLPGLLVWLEIRQAILFNLIIAISWVVITLYCSLLVNSKLWVLAWCMVPFLPFWAGLFPLLRKWKNGVSGQTFR
ncbi:hypothetical protein HHL17_20920 [Chitinophaga sp. G-6-1-13]|uniref:Uncharacterized protein n=1 Tax=Chitinophaga fulva TaxID=2728842 RepID=A0A848GM34_9BACT|nr:hypothetical protein [Chitinophaga fulva]NML39675.1 hypothetical protein [Chitinophaga fulva]